MQKCMLGDWKWNFKSKEFWKIWRRKKYKWSWSCTLRLQGKFVSNSVVNLSKRNLNDAEISLLSKGLILKVLIRVLAVVVWDREHYIIKAEKQLGDEEVYEEVSNDSAPQKDHKCSHSKNKKTGWSEKGWLRLFYYKRSKIRKVYLLPKIHKRLHNVPGRPVISNSGYYTKNISLFLGHHLQSLAQAVNFILRALTNY